MADVAAHLHVLGLDSVTSAEELRTAYLQEIKKWHPDRHQGEPSSKTEATQRAKAINAAFEYFSELLELGHPPCAAHYGRETKTAEPETVYRTQHTYNRKSFTPGFPDPNVFEVFVKSSHIVSIGYSRATHTLYIKFDRIAVYSYRDVPEAIFKEFLAAKSQGKFAHRYIYGKYAYVSH